MCVKRKTILRQSERTSEFVKVGQTSDTSGGVRMMRGRDEALQRVCVCVCGHFNQRYFLSIKSVTCFLMTFFSKPPIFQTLRLQGNVATDASDGARNRYRSIITSPFG